MGNLKLKKGETLLCVTMVMANAKFKRGKSKE